jgi:hypothetical protein
MTRTEIEALLTKYELAYAYARRRHDMGSALKYINAILSIQDELLALA